MKHISRYKEHIKSINKSFNEMAIYQKDLDEFANFISNTNDIKVITNIIKDLILELQNKIINLTSNDIELAHHVNKNITIYYTNFPENIKNIINKLNKILFDKQPKNDSQEEFDDIDDDLEYKKNKETYDIYLSLIYPDKILINDWSFKFYIYTDENNRIHFINELPTIIRKLGLMTKFYKRLIDDDRIRYISTEPTDRTTEIEFVWNSLSKDSKYYTFLEGERAICFSRRCKFDYIINILRRFKTSDQFILDSDFKEKYKEDILKSDFKDFIK